MAHPARRSTVLSVLVLIAIAALPIQSALGAEDGGNDPAIADRHDAMEQHAVDTREKAAAMRASLLELEQNAHDRHANQRQRHDAIVQKHRDLMQRHRLRQQRRHVDDPGGGGAGVPAARRPADFAALRKEHDDMMRDHEQRMNSIRLEAERLKGRHDHEHDEI